MVRAFWYMSNNFGDNINHYLIKKISGKEPVYTDNRNEKHFIVCGSILTEANHASTVWGAGAAWHHDQVNQNAKIITVRGELSRQKVKECQYVGDPSLLMPRLYTPNVDGILKYRHGFIPHWKDLERAIYMNTPETKIISPLQPVQKVIDDICTCETISSSSLHGLILADSYNVPNRWVDFGTDIGGDGFKFQDYYTTTDRAKTVNEKDFYVSKYKHNLEDYLKTCPFL